MATGVINKAVPDSGEGYCKMPDGTLIQWGTTMCKNPTGEASTMTVVANVNLYSGSVSLYTPLYFVDTNYIVVGRSKYDTGLEMAFSLANAVNGHNARIRVYDNYARPLNDGKMILKWVAVGRWK